MSTTPNPTPELDAASASAIDALFEHGYDPAANSDALEPPASPQLAALLQALRTPLANEDPSLVDVTMLRVQRATSAASTQTELELVPADQEALEALAREGYAMERVPRALRDRAQRHLHLANACQTPVAAEGANSLIDSTFRKVQAQDAALDPIPFESRRRLPALRLADVVSVAALMLIATSIVVPVFAAMRSSSMRTACEANMMTTASAMGLYAGAYDGSLPVQTAGFGGGGGSWMHVGTPRESNSANLYTLVSTQHARLNDLACPGNRAAPTVQTDPEAQDWDSIEEISYSYQIVTGFHPNWNSTADGRSPVILADRSPVILRAVAGDLINPWEASPNHGRRGQHVLKTDGSSTWQTEAWPEGEDNIWLPRAIETAIGEIREQAGLITGTELPADSADTFLGP